eukprot:1389236-Karenia_brevis.AAC.1
MAGREYGLILNWKKVEKMDIQCEACNLIDEDGNYIADKNSMKYLGALIVSDGKMESEVAQKIGEAR